MFRLGIINWLGSFSPACLQLAVDCKSVHLVNDWSDFNLGFHFGPQFNQVFQYKSSSAGNIVPFLCIVWDSLCSCDRPIIFRSICEYRWSAHLPIFFSIMRLLSEHIDSQFLGDDERALRSANVSEVAWCTFPDSRSRDPGSIPVRTTLRQVHTRDQLASPFSHFESS